MWGAFPIRSTEVNQFCMYAHLNVSNQGVNVIFIYRSTVQPLGNTYLYQARLIICIITHK